MESQRGRQDGSSGWARLAEEVRTRRQWLQLSHHGVSRRGGPSHETVRLIENQGRPSFREMTLTQLDRALEWKPGMAARIVGGTAPADRREWEADLTPAEMEQRAEAIRRLKHPDPEGMSPLPVSLDNVSDFELAGELVSRLTRGHDMARNRDLLGELLGLLSRLSAPEDDKPAAAS